MTSNFPQVDNEILDFEEMLRETREAIERKDQEVKRKLVRETIERQMI
jgi:hypothetical protein